MKSDSLLYLRGEKELLLGDNRHKVNPLMGLRDSKGEYYIRSLVTTKRRCECCMRVLKNPSGNQKYCNYCTVTIKKYHETINGLKRTIRKERAIRYKLENDKR